MTFEEIERRWQYATSSSREVRRALWDELSGPSHGWLQACRTALATQDVQAVDAWLDPNDDVKQACITFANGAYAQTARAYLICTKALLQGRREVASAPHVEEMVHAVVNQSAEFSRPLNWWRDLFRTLQLGDTSPSILGSQRLPVLLVDPARSNAPGEVGELTLDLRNGSGALYPDISLAFVRFDAGFGSAEQAVCRYLRNAGVWANDWDVCWRITRPNLRPLPALTGGSTSAALALGLAKLFAQQGNVLFEDVSELPLRRLGITATCDAEGNLGPVSDVRAKLSAAQSSAHIRQIILASQQADKEPFLHTATQGLEILSASTLQEAVMLLTEHFATQPNPFRPFTPFREQDARYFFGRDHDKEALATLVHESRFVTLVGPSGGGKSSLVFAGLVPTLLASQNWMVVSCRPKADPFAELARALVQRLASTRDANQQEAEISKLSRNFVSDTNRQSLTDALAVCLSELSNKRLLIVIDQFEELYATTDVAQRTRFLEDLSELARSPLPCSILVVLRADALEQILSLSARGTGAFPALYNDYRQRILAHMSHDELLQAVRSHADAAGLDLEGGLLERLVGDLYREAGSLPFLQVTLTQLFHQRIGQTLTHEAYNRLGTVNQVVANYADEVLHKLAQEETLSQSEIDEQVGEIFVQLVQLDEGDSNNESIVSTLHPKIATRQQVGASRWPMVQKLANAWLVVTGRNAREHQETVEVSHQSLITHWPHLHAWVHQYQEFRRWQDSLRQAMARWHANQRDEKHLLQGGPLEEAEAMRRRYAIRLRGAKSEQDHEFPEEHEFIERSVRYRNRMQAEREWLQMFRLLLVASLCTAVCGAVVRWGFYEWFGSFLQPIDPNVPKLSHELWNGFLGAFLGAFYVIAAFEFPSWPRKPRFLSQHLLILLTGPLWGATIFVAINVALNAADIEKIGWTSSRDTNAQYAFMITGLGWSSAMALAHSISRRATPYIRHDPILIHFFTQLGMTLLFSLLSPLVLLSVLKNMPHDVILCRSWGESLGQCAIAWITFCFYFSLRWNLLDKLWPRRMARNIVTVRGRTI